jgi:hypothetical protein
MTTFLIDPRSVLSISYYRYLEMIRAAPVVQYLTDDVDITAWFRLFDCPSSQHGILEDLIASVALF